MICRCCEMLVIGEPIKVIDVHYENPFMEDVYHFEEGFKCMYNGIESVDMEDLIEGNCRCQ